MRLSETMERNLSVLSYGDKPDLICRDDQTNRTIGIEITELLNLEQGRYRSLSEKSANIIRDILKKYAKGGIVSIDYGTKLPENKEELSQLKSALEAAILESGGFQSFVKMVKSTQKWESHGFIISEITLDEDRDEWLPLCDAPLPYQSFTVNEEDVIQRVRKKADQSKGYRKTDELHLLIRNPHAKWEPDENIKQKITIAKGERIHSVWLTNWKMATLPIQSYIIQIDQQG
jgi:hypothetical protein